MSRERWGTFSVADHLRSRAFVTEVLLYDRLIIPVPADPAERDRWTTTGWQPDQLDRALDVLGERAIRVPWDEPKRAMFKTRFAAAKSAEFDTRNLATARQSKVDPLYVTRTLLAQDFLPDLPRGVIKVWPLAAYSSLATYKEDDEATDPGEKKEKLAMVLSHRFLVPEIANCPDLEMLKRAVELASREDFQAKRADFHRWQEDIIQQEIPPHKAVEEMEQYLKKYNAVVRKATKDVAWKFGFLLLRTALDVVGAGFGEPTSIAGALVDVISFGKFERRPDIDAGECQAAAMIHDIKTQLHWNNQHPSRFDS